MTSELPLIIRPATAADEDFIVDSWIQSYIEGRCDFTARAKVVRDGLRQLIPRLLEKSETAVAAPSDEPQLIAGWACVSEQGWLHYLYTRASFRRMGVSTQLQAAMGVDPTETPVVTHITNRILHRWPSVIYNPYALFEVL